MKKKFMFIALIATLGMGAFLTSCEKEDESCECVGEAVISYYDYYGDYYEQWEEIDDDFEPADYDVTTCDDLEKKLKKEYRGDGYNDVSIKCKAEK